MRQSPKQSLKQLNQESINEEASIGGWKDRQSPTRSNLHKKSSMNSYH